MLVLCPKALLNSFIGSNRFLSSRQSFIYIHHLQIEKIDPFSFQHFHFSCLIALARTFSIMLSWSSESRHPNPREIFFSL